MRRILATLLALLLIAPPLPALARPIAPLDSIAPIQEWRDYDEDGIAQLENICTASLIDIKRRLWITAAHCVDDIGTFVYIAGHEGVVFIRIPAHDLAVVTVPSLNPTPYRVLRLGSAPHKGDMVHTAGYSIGYHDSFYFQGVVSQLTYRFLPGQADHLLSQEYAVFAFPAAGGQSGSPVVDKKGRLVSIVQIKFGGDVFGPVSGGVTYDSLLDIAAYFQYT